MNEQEQRNPTVNLPDDLVFYYGFPMRSGDTTTDFYIVAFERRHKGQADQFYMAIMDIHAPVSTYDPQQVFAVALVWDKAASAATLRQKINEWLGGGR